MIWQNTLFRSNNKLCHTIKEKLRAVSADGSVKGANEGEKIFLVQLALKQTWFYFVFFHFYSYGFWELEASPKVVVPGEETSIFISRQQLSPSENTVISKSNYSNQSLVVTMTIFYEPGRLKGNIDHKFNSRREIIHQKVWRERLIDLIRDTDRFHFNSGKNQRVMKYLLQTQALFYWELS